MPSDEIFNDTYYAEIAEDYKLFVRFFDVFEHVSILNQLFKFEFVKVF